MSHQSEIWAKLVGGDRWKPEEVREALPTMPAERVKNALWQMASKGYVMKFQDGSYGVTHRCTVPHGMTVAQVLKATGAA